MLLPVKKLIADRKISPNLKKIIFNTGWLFADRFLQMAVGLFVGIWVTRYLGPVQFGLFNYALAFASLFAGFANLGLDGIVIRDAVRYPSASNEILGTTFVLRIISCAVTGLMAIAVIFVLRPGDSLTHLMVGILTINSFFNAFPIDVWFQAQVRAKQVVLAKNAAYLVMCVVRVALISLKAPLVAFAWVTLAETALSAIAQIVVYQAHKQSVLQWQYNAERAKGLLKESWPLVLTGMVVFIYMRADQIMIGQMMGDREVGIYSAAAKISEMWYFVPAAIANSVFPSIVQAREVSKELCEARMQKLFSLMTIMAYAVAIPITFIANQIVVTLYGKEFMAAGAILTVHIWAGVFVSLGLARSPWILAEGLTKFTAAASAVGGLVNVGLNLILIPRFGAMGASVATVIAQAIASYLMHAFHPKTRVIFVMQTKAILGLTWGKELFTLFKKQSQV